MTSQDQKIENVENIGPLVEWKKPFGIKSPLIVMSTEVENKVIKYHIHSNDFTNEYQEALQKSIFVDTISKPKTWMIAKKRKSRCIDSDFEDSSECSDDDFILPQRKKMKIAKAVKKPGKSLPKTATILKSFHKEPGFGDSLIELLPKSDKKSSDALASFLCFVFERQTMWTKRRKGCKTLTSNRVLAEKFFTNMYRELDTGSIFLRSQVNQTDMKGIKKTIDMKLVQKILFKVVVYRLINNRQTFMDFGGLPDIHNFSKFRKFLGKRRSEGLVIFTAAHQNNGFSRLMLSCQFLKDNISKLSSDLVAAAKKRSLKMCFEVVRTIPYVGDFFANQILCDLLECRIFGSNVSEDQWGCLGPGAKHGLRRIFDFESSEELKYTRLLRDLCSLDGPKSSWSR